MILLCCGEVSRKHIDALMLFAHQLDQRGHQVAIDPRFIPEDLTKQGKYEVAPFLADMEDIVPSCVVVIGADEVSDAVQALLGSVHLDEGVPVWITAQFADLQAEINARNKIAYATGREPHLLNLARQQHGLISEGAIAPMLTDIRETPDQNDGTTSRVLIYVPSETLEETATALQSFALLAYNPMFEIHLLTNAKGKSLIRASRYADLSVFSYSELPPNELLHYFDILVFLGHKVPGERMAMLALKAMGAGKVVIDGTEQAELALSGAPVLKGPPEAAALPMYLLETVARNRQEIGLRTLQSDWLRAYDVGQMEAELGLQSGADDRAQRKRRTLFVPTNGNGLGHAQRCAVIAEEMPKDNDLSFAAFPSCVDMLRGRGVGCLPLVQRSADHLEEYAADLLNYLRLRGVVAEEDHIVFDGGYVFDSIYRLISQRRLRATWIRRGLWRHDQDNTIALERERAFSRVIVPVEAFDELNKDYSTGKKIHKVGPVVRRESITLKQTSQIRKKLSAQFDRQIDTLVVSMLGGGVASDRTAQTQLLCNMLEARSNTLHLVIAWPQAFVPSALYGWQNTKVVQTTHSSALAQAADLCISAAGYNSFHELLYAQVPTIFIPQTAAYLDDQERRAEAAFERGIAGFVAESEVLKLEREVAAFLDGGKSDDIRKALSAQPLPQTGNAAAAQLIEEGSTQ